MSEALLTLLPRSGHRLARSLVPASPLTCNHNPSTSNSPRSMKKTNPRPRVYVLPPPHIDLYIQHCPLRKTPSPIPPLSAAYGLHQQIHPTILPHPLRRVLINNPPAPTPPAHALVHLRNGAAAETTLPAHTREIQVRITNR